MNTLFAKAVLMLDTLANKLPDNWKWVGRVSEAIDSALWPILIVVAAAGTIYAVVLGVNMARADSTEKREEAKKRVINVLVGMIIIVGLILLLKLFFAEGGWKNLIMIGLACILLYLAIKSLPSFSY